MIPRERERERERPVLRHFISFSYFSFLPWQFLHYAIVYFIQISLLFKKSYTKMDSKRAGC